VPIKKDLNSGRRFGEEAVFKVSDRWFWSWGSSVSLETLHQEREAKKKKAR